jgi:hypothetical protein
VEEEEEEEEELCITWRKGGIAPCNVSGFGGYHSKNYSKTQ